jgi:hypothetical protein
MRSHGVPNFPDPPNGGAVPKGSAQQFGVSSSQLQARQTACQQLVVLEVDRFWPTSIS